VPWLRPLAHWTARESWSVITKELLKRLVIGIGAIIGAWFLAVVSSILQVSGNSWSAVFEKIWQSTVNFFRNPISYSVDTVLHDPVYFAVFLVLGSIGLTLAALLRRSNYRLRDASITRALAVQAGIGGRWPHARTDNPEGAPWSELCNEIVRLDNHLLFILGANGVETFGSQQSPLYQVMQQFHGDIRVILMDPDSAELAGRARAVSIDPVEYKRAIRASERRLKDLRRQQHAVDGRFYTGQPNWKFIITSTTAWIQYYLPGGRHVNETPVWRFDATPDGDGMYGLFRIEFDRVWKRCNGNSMNLRY